MSNWIQPHDVAGTTCWLKLRAGATKEGDAETVTGGGGDLAKEAGNRSGLGKDIPLTSSPFLIRLKGSLDTGGLYKGNCCGRGTGRLSSQFQ